MRALPSAATRGHWFPLLELQAASVFGPVPYLLQPVQPRHLLSPSRPGANTDQGDRRALLTEHPPFPCQGRPGAGPGLRSSDCFWEALLSNTGNEEVAQHHWLQSVSQPRLPRFLHRGTAPGSVFPLKGPGRPGVILLFPSPYWNRTGRTALHPSHLLPER